jgi:predicted permease
MPTMVTGGIFMEFLNLWNLQGQLLLLLVIGAFLRRFGIFTGQTKAFLTDFVIYVTLPCSIILSFRMDIDSTVLVSFALVLVVSVVIQLFCMLLGVLLYRRQSAPRRSVLRYGILVSNAGFMGLPIAGELFGSGGLMFASIYLIPQRIVLWTAGISCFSHEDVSWKQTVKKIAIHPGLVSVYIGLLVMFFNPPIPVFIEKTMASIGSCTTPLSMMLIGSIVGEMDRTQMRIDWFSLGYSAIRLGLIPLAAYLGCRAFSIDPLITSVSVLLAGMPVGSTTAIIAAKYGGDAPFASQLVTISTVLSMVSIPLWAFVLA